MLLVKLDTDELHLLNITNEKFSLSEYLAEISGNLQKCHTVLRNKKDKGEFPSFFAHQSH